MVAALYLADLHDGANTVLGGLALAATEAFVLLGLLLTPWTRGALAKSSGPLGLPAAAFAVTVVIALWSLTPWVPGGAHPAWTYVGGLGAATLDRSNTLFEILKLDGLACIFLTAFGIGRADDRARLAVHALVLGGALYALWSLILFGIDRDPGATRLTGTFQSANTAATLFAALIVTTCGLALSAQRRASGRGKLGDLVSAAPYWAIAALFGACLFLTASRGGIAAAAVGLALFVGLEALAGRIRLWVALAGGGVAAAVLALQSPVLLGRLADGADQSGRGQMFAIYWRAFQESPLMGYGLGSFDAVNKLHLSTANFGAVWAPRAAHNVYLQWLLEAGLIGALPMFACIALVLFLTWRGLGRRLRATSLIRGLLAVDAVFLVHGWSDFALQVPAMAALWAFVLGLQLSLATSSSNTA
jgi:O-antigen ligase